MGTESELEKSRYVSETCGIMSYFINDIMGENDDDNSELSDQGRFLTKGKWE